MTKNEIKL